MPKRGLIFVLACLLAFPSWAHPREDTVQNVLSKLENDIQNATTQNDINTVLSYLHPEVLIVLENDRIFHSTKELEKYIKKPLYFNGIKINKIRIKTFEIDKPIIELSHNSVLVNGKILVKYSLSNAKELELNSRWMATLIKENDKWVVRSYQSTSDIFNNPFIDDARYDFYFIIFVTLIIGAILGFVWKKIRLKK